MRKIFLPVLLLAVLFCIPVYAQQISKPTLTPSEPTPSQKALIQEGIRFHDQKQYAEAIKKYEEVLQENPSCVTAIYEKTLSLYYNKEYQRTLETAFEGIKYKSNEIPLFYGLIANVYDDQGNPEKAVNLYKQGIKMLEGDKTYESYLSSLYYNLSVTNFRQKDLKQARENLKKAVPLNFKYASPHALLSEVFYEGNYKIPAFLAASRLISLELNSPRSRRAALMVKNVLEGGVKPGSKPGDLNISVDFNTPKDEGDFDSLGIILGLSKVGSGITAEEKNQTEEDRFASQIESIIGFLEREEKLKSTFVGQNYVPYMIELKRRGHVKAFAYVVLFQAGSPAAQTWLRENNQTALNFVNWARSYQLSAQK